jgi:hypothetical protein
MIKHQYYIVGITLITDSYVYLIKAHMCDKHITLCLKWQMALLHVFMQNNYIVFDNMTHVALFKFLVAESIYIHLMLPSDYKTSQFIP